MEKQQLIKGFSKKTRDEKLNFVSQHCTSASNVAEMLKSFHHPNPKIQKLLEEFSENTISNFPLPLNICPNLLVNGKSYLCPMVIEESSVVAAASHAAKYWFVHGGFHTEILGLEKVGQVHFLWNDDKNLLFEKFDELKEKLIRDTFEITENMIKRGGGIQSIELRDLSAQEPGLMQLYVTFNTVDSMGANFINSCLEQFSKSFQAWHAQHHEFKKNGLEVIMCILSNFTPNCKVRCWVEAPISEMDDVIEGMSGVEFARRFRLGIRVAELDPHRSTTHNKGIMNGIDAVVLASGNDFRAVEACAHTYAAKDGKYTSLSHCSIENGIFRFEAELPFAVGVVGGLTNLHPLVKFCLELLDHPSAEELMSIAAAVGLANNFSAVKNLVTVGIQQGHMKMHLLNIMNQLEIPENEKPRIIEYFKNKVVSVSAVRNLAYKWELIKDKLTK